MLSAEERRHLALRAATVVARRLGLGEVRPQIIKDSNNTIVHFVPSPIVAKVGTSHFREAKLESLERELAVATHLARREAPIVRPSRAVAPGPHRMVGLTLTLWEYVASVPSAVLDPSETAGALRSVHEALLDFSEPLPAFTLELEDARKLLQPDRSPALSVADRSFLFDVLGEVEASLSARMMGSRPLHGSPHEGNWLVTETGPVLLDFETACIGPPEWDLAALDDAAVALCPGLDDDLISVLRRMRSLCVAAKCWVEPDRAPELGEAAHVHLKLLRGQRLD
jgi:hypothetical protein